jgi:hypothetical protein
VLHRFIAHVMRLSCSVLTSIGRWQSEPVVADVQLPPGVLERNLGVPLVVVGLKADAVQVCDE